ncbi:hypothetical protein AMECASPLE_038805 [Ameca splendens]|uniref:Uncharacterized protein n=1 Tax=Ameca splendens TaxID=208324 RepID=A0ABV1AER4_9TELE
MKVGVQPRSFLFANLCLRGSRGTERFLVYLLPWSPTDKRKRRRHCRWLNCLLDFLANLCLCLISLWIYCTMQRLKEEEKFPFGTLSLIFMLTSLVKHRHFNQNQFKIKAELVIKLTRYCLRTEQAFKQNFFNIRARAEQLSEMLYQHVFSM